MNIGPAANGNAHASSERRKVFAEVADAAYIAYVWDIISMLRSSAVGAF